MTVAPLISAMGPLPFLIGARAVARNRGSLDDPPKPLGWTGRFWTDDYGSSDNPEEFAALRAYSPYHNIREGAEYPAILVTTADTDDRVVPGHSFKYAAAIQRAQGGNAPVLIRIETRAGHGAGVPTDKVIEDYADRWAFIVRNLDMRLPEGYAN